MNEQINNRFLFPLLLLVLSFLIYGLLIPTLGFYWDDLPYYWFNVVKGVRGTVDAIALDRPILSVFYYLPISILGENPIIWQIFGVLTRWIFTLSMFGFLQSLWHENRSSNQLITLLLLVFPGFTQQWISVIYSHAFVVLSIYFLSLMLFTKSIRKGKYFSVEMGISLVLAVSSMAAMEYVVGLEFIRPVIIYFVEKNRDKQKPFLLLLKTSLIKWLPFLASLVLFILYRSVIASSVLYKVQGLSLIAKSPFLALWDLGTTQFRNLFTSTFLTWLKVFEPFSYLNLRTTFGKMQLAFYTFLFFFSLTILLIHSKAESVNSKKSINKLNWQIEALVLAIVILLSAGIPFWAANLQTSVNFPNDRFLLSFMVGSTLIIYLAINLIRKSKWIWRILFCLIFTLAGGYQFYQANSFRNDWNDFTNFMQQLSWRIPSVANNVLFATNELPLIHYSDNSLTAAINWLYADKESINDLPIMLNYTSVRLGTSLPALDKGVSIHQNYRIFTFKGSTDEMILFYHQPPGCVHILDPVLDQWNPLIPVEIREKAQLSNNALISNVEEQNNVFFLPENDHKSWCYYYQKASLAYQFQDWETIAHLGGVAFSLNDYPNDASERIPFIFGYAHTGEWEKSLQLTQTTYQISELYQPMLCEVWKILESTTVDSSEKENAGAIAVNTITCN